MLICLVVSRLVKLVETGKMHGMKEMFIPPFAQIVVKMFRINIGKNI